MPFFETIKIILLEEYSENIGNCLLCLCGKAFFILIRFYLDVVSRLEWMLFLRRIFKCWYSLESHNRIGFVVVIIAIVAIIIINLALMIFIILFWLYINKLKDISFAFLLLQLWPQFLYTCDVGIYIWFKLSNNCSEH